MISPTSYPIVLHADREHRGVRFGVVSILFVAFWLSYFVVSLILRQLFPSLPSVIVLSCAGAIPLSLLVTAVGEALLKRHWHSGRLLRLEEDRIVLRRPAYDDISLDRSNGIHQLRWLLPLSGYARGGRERRISNKWFCLAVQMQDEDERIVVFTYVSPRRKEEILKRHELLELDPGQVYDTSFSARFRAPSRPEISPEVIAGKRGQYWLAERERWRAGVELEPDDFEVLLQYLAAESR
jgi:hypothetical protein